MQWPRTPFPIHLTLITLLLLTGGAAGASDPIQPIPCLALPGGIQPGSEAHLDGICAALNAQPDLPQDLGLALIVEVLTNTHVTAYLQWQTPDGPTQGPSVSFGFLDTELSPEQYGFVANGLVRATNLL